MAPAWSSRASCDPAPCRAHRPPWPTSWDCATWPSRSTTCRRLPIGPLPRATDWSVASASTRALGGWPMSGGRKGSSSHWPSASAEPRNARICAGRQAAALSDLADDGGRSEMRHAGPVVDDSMIVAHDEPAARSRTNYILRLSLAAAGLPGRYEQVWTRTEDKVSFELCCIPFFTYDLSLG